MTQTRPHPDLWYAIAHFLAALRQLLRATAPDAFAQIAVDARAHLAAITAMVRRYIHILAADITLPPRALSPPTDHPAERASSRRGRPDYRFPLVESPSKPSRATPGEDSPELQWALLMEAARRLISVMANPAPHALRLARALRRRTGDALRELTVRWSVIRRIGPVLDTLLLRLDQLARPKAWEGIDTS